MYFITIKRMLEVCFSAHPNIQYRAYFLYDWHQKDPSHRLHGFRHPKTALGNAQRDYYLNWKEKNIIARHMFPLIPVPPQCREAWIVCLADKWCALGETMEPMFHVKHFK